MANLLDIMKKDYEDKAAAYALVYNQHKSTPKELKALKKTVNEAVNAYNNALAQDTYRKWHREGDAVKTAIRSRIIPKAISVTLKPNDNDFVVIKEKEINTYEVNLPLMQATIGAEAFADPEWYDKCQALAALIASSIRMSKENKADYIVSDAAKAFKFPEGTNPLDTKSMIAALQIVFDSILYIDNPDNPGTNLIRVRELVDDDNVTYSEGWTTLRESMTKESGESSFSICGPAKFSNLIMRAMHTIFTSREFKCEIDNSYGVPQVFEIPEDVDIESELEKFDV